MITIFKNGYMEILKDESRYVIRYDSGDIGGTIREVEVTEEEAIRAQESDDAAYWVIIHHRNIERLGEDYMNR